MQIKLQGKDVLEKDGKTTKEQYISIKNKILEICKIWDIQYLEVRK